MLTALLVVLILLWFLGYIHISSFPVPDIVLFHINGQPITLWNILTLIVISWLLGILPSPFRQIAGVLLFLWILSTLGILAFTGSSSLLVIAVIVGLIFFLLEDF